MKVNSSMPRGSALLYPAAFGLSFVPNAASAVALTSEGDAIKGFTSYNYSIK